MKILVLNGPNLSRLDIRDSAVYGDLDFAQLESLVKSRGKELGFEIDFRQSDDEATIIGWLHERSEEHTSELQSH